MADPDIKAKGLAKQTLVIPNILVSKSSLELISKDDSFVPPFATKARSLAKQVLLTPVTTISNFNFEILADANSVIPGDTRAKTISKQVLVVPNTLVENYSVEAIGHDDSFRRPGDTLVKSVVKQTLLAPPSDIIANNVALEVIASGVTITHSALRMFEVVSGLPYSVPTHNYTMEVVDLSTITPPQPTQRAVWFTLT